VKLVHIAGLLANLTCIQAELYQMEAALSTGEDPLWVVPYTTVANDYHSLLQDYTAYVEVCSLQPLACILSCMGTHEVTTMAAAGYPSLRHLARLESRLRFFEFHDFLLCTSMPSAAGKSVCHISLLWMIVLYDQLCLSRHWGLYLYLLNQPSNKHA